MRPVVHAHDEHVAERVGSGVDQHVAEARADSNAEYSCPMHPEVRQNGPGKCPKCGMFLEPVGAASAHGAHRHAHHVDERHRQHHATPAAKGGKDVEYTCPMHPQVRQMGPGNCPICGMALEPVIATGETGESPELRDMTRRFWMGLGLTLPVFALEMGGHVFDIGHLVGTQTSNWIQMVLATPVVLWAGWPFFARGWASVKNRSLNMFTLIALGTGAAWLYSMVGTLAPGLFPPELRSHGGAVAVYFEAAAVITVLVLLGQMLELRAREKTSGAIKALLDLAPKTAIRVQPDGSDETVQIDNIQVGESSPRAAWREGPCGRRGHGGQRHRRRVHGHRRAHARGQGCRAPG